MAANAILRSPDEGTYTMQRRDFEAWIPDINATVAEAATRFCRETGKKAESIHESVLEESIYEKFAETHHLSRQMPVTRLWNRNCQAQPMPFQISSMTGEKVDLVALAANLGSCETVIELKLWNRRKAVADQDRIERLLRHVPDLRYGLLVMLIDQPSTDQWVKEELRPMAEEKGHGFWVLDAADCICTNSRQCSVVTEATYYS